MNDDKTAAVANSILKAYGMMRACQAAVHAPDSYQLLDVAHASRVEFQNVSGAAAIDAKTFNAR